MKKIIATVLGIVMPLSTALAFAAPNDGDEFQISCAGRPTMTIDRAEYGISTLMWGDNNFQIAAGQDRTRLQDGQPVSITLFRNGDQLMVDNATQNTFFVYAGTTTLVPCERTDSRPDPLLTLTPLNYSAATGSASS
ncbi:MULTISPECIES: hypothetical protein [unclassified Tatumella]|uniref:hypothetical protein n=1 Tax=unclassified Tatumella TaxID=2649542 RepID=UPI002010D585|nr:MULTISPECIES: hypothetical protein [unclassified Tatumella]